MTKTRRDFLEESLLAAAAAITVPMIPGVAGARTGRVSANDKLNIAVIGVRGRGAGHVGTYLKSKNANVVAICDPDEAVIGRSMRAVKNANKETGGEAKYYKDIRKLLEDESIDAVSIATPNHWHSLGAIWSLQAGKHVYVEKPVSHNVLEGRRVVEAARKYGKVVQHGTQARSHKACQDAIAWMHAGNLGKVNIARGLCYKRRGSIGKVKGPQKPPATCDYDLWTGPAAMKPLMRKNLHYDWHWVYETGNGDLGNQGVHQVDLCRWGLGRDTLPNKVRSCGGRLGYVDDGDTANTQISVCDWDDQQLIFEVRGLKTGGYKGAHIGVVFHCDDGYIVIGSYGKCHAFDHDGKVIKTFQGGGNNFQNWVDAALAGKSEMLNAEILEGHLSAAVGHLGNVSYMLGSPRPLGSVDDPFGEVESANETFHRFRDHLAENGVGADQNYAMGPELTLDPANERFTGELAQKANPLLTRRYRAPFVVPDEV